MNELRCWQKRKIYGKPRGKSSTQGAKMAFDDLNFLQLVPEPPGQWYDIAFGIVPSCSIVVITFLMCLGIYIFKGNELVVKVKQPIQIMISLAFLLLSTIAYAVCSSDIQ